MMSLWILSGNLLSRSPYSFSKERLFIGTVFQEIMRGGGPPVKAPPLTRRRIIPSTPQQSSHSSHEELQWQAEMEVQGTAGVSAKGRFFAKKEDYLNNHDSVKVEVEELELMMSPEDSEVHLRYILMNASRRSSNIFEILSTTERKKGALSCKQSATGAAPETEGRDEL